MSKKPAAALSASLVAVKGTATPAADMPGRIAPAPAALPPVPSVSIQPRVKRSAVKAVPTQAERNSPKVGQGEAGGQPLNFRVPDRFRREFKVYAAEHGLKLNELLRLSFEAYRNR